MHLGELRGEVGRHAPVFLGALEVPEAEERHPEGEPCVHVPRVQLDDPLLPLGSRLEVTGLVVERAEFPHRLDIAGIRGHGRLQGVHLRLPGARRRRSRRRVRRGVPWDAAHEVDTEDHPDPHQHRQHRPEMARPAGAPGGGRQVREVRAVVVDEDVGDVGAPDTRRDALDGVKVGRELVADRPDLVRRGVGEAERLEDPIGRARADGRLVVASCHRSPRCDGPGAVPGS